MLRRFVDFNVRLSRSLDSLLPIDLQIDGNRDFKRDFVWTYLNPRQRIYDVGGGKQPFLSTKEKSTLAASVIGIDISEEELSKAPVGAYEATVAADIQCYKGNGDGDIVICQALLEHVPNVGAALASIATLLKSGGTLLLFVPCRNAAFARLNLLIPESTKRKILFTVFPSTRQTQGFPSYYDHCTPSQIEELARLEGLSLVDVRRYYISSYFSFFFPLYAFWRLWTMMVIALGAGDLCETFSMALVLRRPAQSRDRF